MKNTYIYDYIQFFIRAAVWLWRGIYRKAAFFKTYDKIT